MITTIKEKLIIDNGFYKVFNDHVSFGNSEGHHLKIVASKGKGGVIVLPFHADGRLYLHKEYRYASQQWLISSVAGMQEDSESAIETAHRELSEEMSLTTTDMIYLGSINELPSLMKQNSSIFIALNCQPINDNTNQDESEFFSNKILLSLDEVDQLIINQDITYASLMCAIYKAKLFFATPQ